MALQQFGAEHKTTVLLARCVHHLGKLLTEVRRSIAAVSTQSGVALRCGGSIH